MRSNIPPNYRLIIFDWDGTLMDSVTKIVVCMQKASSNANLAIPSKEAIKNIIGLGLSDAIFELHPDVHTRHRALVEEYYRQLYIDQDKTSSPLFPGAKHVLKTLSAKGYELSIATGKSRRGLDRVLSELGLNDLFSASRCADETHPKPHPAMVDEILEDVGCRPSQALVVGDTEYDMAMAKSAKVDRLAVSYGAHHIDRLKPYQPVHAIDEIGEILPWLDEIIF